MNLYNKIYEAIDAGIQKALIVKNNQTEDISVGWQQRNISASYNTINIHVNELLNGPDSKEAYNTLKKICKKFIC